MRAGKLDRRIGIQRATITLGTDGTPVEAWTVIALVFAAVTPASGREGFSVPQYTSYEVVEFEVRALASTIGLTTKDRLVYPYDPDPSPDDPAPTAVYDILAIHEVGRREGFKMTAQRRPDVGN
jgi:head-tail adaptor